MRVNEIERYPADNTDNSAAWASENAYEPVPGLKPVSQNSQYGYTFRKLSGVDRLNLTGTDMTFEFFHVKDNLARYIGFLSFRETSARGLKNPIQVSNVVLDPSFRNWGVGMMMYGVVLGLGYTILADNSQTPQARKLWVRLWEQPGVTVRGIMDVLSSYVDPERDNSWNDEATQIKTQLRRIKAQSLLPFNRRRRYGDDWERYSFEVKPNKDQTELIAPGVSLYRKSGRWDDYDLIGLYATLSSVK
jgi:hypothetical protein